MQDIIYGICNKVFGAPPEKLRECKTGFANFVCETEVRGEKYMIRCNDNADAYKETACILGELAKLDVPVPEIVSSGLFRDRAYLVLTYIPGQDIGEVYAELTPAQKERIARDVVKIQRRVAAMELHGISGDFRWRDLTDEILETAAERIAANGYFSTEKAEILRGEAAKMDAYFAKVLPTAYLDDISTKNLLINDGRVSGIIDVDTIGAGDKLTFAALTYVALLNMSCDTDYVKCLLKYMNISGEEQKAFLFYALLYCVDFMGERGMTFVGRTVEVNPTVIDRLNAIYDELWAKWLKCAEEDMSTDDFLRFI